MMASSKGESSRLSSIKTSKRRGRACDGCRKKRARCDGSDRPRMECSGCIAQGLECTYVEQASRRAPSSSQQHVTILENRLGELDQILRRLCPDEAIYEMWIETAIEEPFDETPPTSPFTNFPPLSIFQPEPLESITHFIRRSHSDKPTSPIQGPMEEEDDVKPTYLSSLDTNHFLGKSCEKGLVRRTLSMKTQYVGSERPVLPKLREEFWTLRPWERKVDVFDMHLSYIFPEPDLGGDLVKLYFEHLNLYQPLLHRPSFERSVCDGLHHGNEGFASVYLLVCAIGAQFSNDPRVRLDEVDSRHSAGWKWFNQVETIKVPFFALPSLYEIQAYCLAITFIQCSAAPQSVWTLVGIALRLILAVDVYRQKTAPPTVESELWKRAFWVLICMDRIVCLSFGRPLSIREEEFDVDMPIDCDDEYWEHPDPEKQFQQPPDKPSLMTGFIQLLKLMKILSTCGRVLYPLNKTTAHLGLGVGQWRTHIVPELDSTLNKWLASMPAHLRWDPDQPNDKFFHQAATLYSMSCYTHIFIHRPFLASPGKSTSAPFPSLAICTTAARSCIHVASAQLQRGASPPLLVQVSVFMSAVMLLFGIWDRKNTWTSRSSALDQSPDMEDVRMALQILQAAEDTWKQAGRLVDILSELSSMSDNPNGRLEQESTEAASEHLVLPHSSTVAISDGMLEDNLNQANMPTVGSDDDAHLAFMQDFLARTPGSEERLWNYALGGLPHDSLLDKRYGLLPDLFAFDPSSALTSGGPSHGTNVRQSGIVRDTHLKEIDYRSMMLMNLGGMAQSSGAHGGMSGASTGQQQQHPGANGAANGSEATDMWLNVPIAFGLEDWDAYLMGVQQERR